MNIEDTLKSYIFWINWKELLLQELSISLQALNNLTDKHAYLKAMNSLLTQSDSQRMDCLFNDTEVMENLHLDSFTFSLQALNNLTCKHAYLEAKISLLTQSDSQRMDCSFTDTEVMENLLDSFIIDSHTTLNDGRSLKCSHISSLFIILQALNNLTDITALAKALDSLLVLGVSQGIESWLANVKLLDKIAIDSIVIANNDGIIVNCLYMLTMWVVLQALNNLSDISVFSKAMNSLLVLTASLSMEGSLTKFESLYILLIDFEVIGSKYDMGIG